MVFRFCIDRDIGLLNFKVFNKVKTNYPHICSNIQIFIKSIVQNVHCTYLSDKLPRIGVRKNPTRGDKHQIKVMYLCATPEVNYIFIFMYNVYHYVIVSEDFSLTWQDQDKINKRSRQDQDKIKTRSRQDQDKIKTRSRQNQDKNNTRAIQDTTRSR